MRTVVARTDKRRFVIVRSFADLPFDDTIKIRFPSEIREKRERPLLHTSLFTTFTNTTLSLYNARWNFPHGMLGSGPGMDIF